MPAVYVQTNDATDNQVVAFKRSDDGSLESLGQYSTGGRGAGQPHLPSQGSVVLTDDGRSLLVTNAGSDEVSVFAVESDELRLTDRVASGGSTPTSAAVRGELAYVLNNGTPNLCGFKLEDGRLTPLEGSERPLSGPDADPAQVAFTSDGSALIVTERGTDSLSSYAVDERGYAEGPTSVKSSGQTPYGFDFTTRGTLVVTEAFGGAIGQAAASSYAVGGAGELSVVSGTVGDTRSEVCWAAVTKDGRFMYVTNFGDGTVSSYAIGDDGTLDLHDAVAGTTREGEKGVRDEAISRDGRFLYAIDADAQQLFGWTIADDGALTAVGAFDGGLPATVAGLAAS
jgi:6-phosphogluconolactonase (cycloisomerase 2 family)